MLYGKWVRNYATGHYKALISCQQIGGAADYRNLSERLTVPDREPPSQDRLSKTRPSEAERKAEQGMIRDPTPPGWLRQCRANGNWKIYRKLKGLWKKVKRLRKPKRRHCEIDRLRRQGRTK